MPFTARVNPAQLDEFFSRGRAESTRELTRVATVTRKFDAANFFLLRQH